MSQNTQSQRLQGKTAVVTGASKGIGAAIARRFASEGAAVVVNYSSSRQDADRVVADIVANGGKAIAVQANVAKKTEVERLFTETQKAFGEVDLLVNNAGVYEFAPLDQITEENFRRQFDTNVLGLLLVTQEAVRHFRPEGGSIINISSLVTTLAVPNSAVYSATKGAVDVITRVLATELGPRKIRVNAINPGMVVTEGVLAAGIDQGDFRKDLESKTPLGRVGQTGDIAPTAAFLASADSAWITGETFLISGGLR